MTLLIILAVIFGIIILIRVMDILQLSTRLAGDNSKDEQQKDINLNAKLLFAFMIIGIFFFFYTIYLYMPLTLPESASEHGVEIDFLLNVNFYIIIAVFILTQVALFWFIYKYSYRPDRKAYFYPHNNTIEVIWTVIPTIVLAVLIVTGLRSWQKITSLENADGVDIEVYSKQFDFIIRYPGANKKLGDSYFKWIADDNPLGMSKTDPDGKDDVMAQEFHMVVNKPVRLNINSRDVLHSVYLPHFRAQMNAVPGMTTYFYFKPTITTAEMRKKLNNDKFDYVLLCNKICGVSHYMMNMKIVVESETEFNAWLATQKPAVAPTKVASLDAETNKAITQK